MESSHKIASGTLLSLSEQQLVDCSTVNYGCNGGWPEEGFNYFMTSKSMSEASYPYTAMDGTCKYNSSATTGVYSSGTYVAIESNNTAAMKAGLFYKPLSVYIEADAAVSKAINPVSSPRLHVALLQITQLILSVGALIQYMETTGS